MESKRIPCVLIVDDDDSIAFFHELMLKQLDITDSIIVKRDGKEAIDYLKTIDATGMMPNLILLDIDMPRMNGYEFLEAYVKLPCEYQISKIIIVSTSSEYVDESKVPNNAPVVGIKSKPLKKATWQAIRAEFGVLL